MVNASAEEAMKKISQVNRWWKKDFSGSAQTLNDQFTVPFTEPSFVDFVVSELVPAKKIVWKVTDCYLGGLKLKKNGIIPKLFLRFRKTIAKLKSILLISV
jgi:hypothetical protein